MSVTAVSAIRLNIEDQSSQQQNSFRQHLLNLQRALSAGSLATAQTVLRNVQQHLESQVPQRNGAQGLAAVNPQSARRSDLQAVQSALDAGDLATAQEAGIRIQRDTHASANLQPALQTQSASTPANALPNQAGDGQDAGRPAGAQSDPSKGNLLDVLA